MTLIDSWEFEFEGEQYEVRAESDGQRIVVAAYKNGGRVNGYTYTVDFTTEFDLSHQDGFRAHKHLMDIAESDVRERQWDRYLQALRDAESGS